MFHWICPECGREIPPAVKECPVCDPQAASAQPPELPPLPPIPHVPEPAPLVAMAVPAPLPAQALAQAQAQAPAQAEAQPLAAEPPVKESPGLALLPPALRRLPLPQLANAVPASTLRLSAIRLRPPVPAPAAQVPVITPVPALAMTPAPTAAALLDAPAEIADPCCPGPDFTKRSRQLLPPAQAPAALAEPSGTLGFAPDGLVPRVLVPVFEAAGASPALELPTSESGDPAPPDLAALADAVSSNAAGAAPAREPAPTAAPVTSRAITLPLAARVALPAPRPGATSLKLIRPETDRIAGHNSLTLVHPPAGNLRAPAPRRASDQFPIPAARKADVPGSRAGTAVQTVEALPVQAGPPAAPSIRPVARPAMAELVDPANRTPRAIRPVRPMQAWFVPPAEPHVTLPGPMLPRELNSLAEAGLRTLHEAPRGPRRSGTGRIWLVLAAVTVLAGGIAYVLPSFLPNGKPAAAVQAETTADPAAANDASADPASIHPTSIYPPSIQPTSAAYALSKTVEVTGFRFVVDFNSKSEIHYLVVNHSAAQLGGVTVYVTLRDANAKPGKPPIARFSFRAPDVPPYSSREMTSPIERISRQTTLPDWQTLQAQVEIAE